MVLDQSSKNRFLRLLKAETLSKLEKNLSVCKLARDDDMFQHVIQIDYIYFPITSIIAVINHLDDGTAPEVATIGNDGIVGIEALIGTKSQTRKYIVQSAGTAYKIPADLIRKIFDEDAEFRDKLLRYINTLFAQAAQLAVCNRFHNIDQQLCRFLLTSIDRWDSHRISLTHQRVATLLGVRRPSVSEASAKLARAGHIHYHRGCVTILNKTGLQQQACECYLVIKKEINALLNY
ncbi:MAG: Crp/Fnr family transcriptional regulator [Methylophilaceae bacterium]|nr:Crp/Fnr family transcriptional regulator [Methylophilaceae bacterium]